MKDCNENNSIQPSSSHLNNVSTTLEDILNSDTLIDSQLLPPLNAFSSSIPSTQAQCINIKHTKSKESTSNETPTGKFTVQQQHRQVTKRKARVSQGIDPSDLKDIIFTSIPTNSDNDVENSGDFHSDIIDFNDRLATDEELSLDFDENDLILFNNNNTNNDNDNDNYNYTNKKIAFCQEKDKHLQIVAIDDDEDREEKVEVEEKVNVAEENRKEDDGLDVNHDQNLNIENTEVLVDITNKELNENGSFDENKETKETEAENMDELEMENITLADPISEIALNLNLNNTITDNSGLSLSNSNNCLYDVNSATNRYSESKFLMNSPDGNDSENKATKKQQDNTSTKGVYDEDVIGMDEFYTSNDADYNLESDVISALKISSPSSKKQVEYRNSKDNETGERGVSRDESEKEEHIVVKTEDNTNSTLSPSLVAAFNSTNLSEKRKIPSHSSYLHILGSPSNLQFLTSSNVHLNQYQQMHPTVNNVSIVAPTMTETSKSNVPGDFFEPTTPEDRTACNNIQDNRIISSQQASFDRVNTSSVNNTSTLNNNPNNLTSMNPLSSNDNSNFRLQSQQQLQKNMKTTFISDVSALDSIFNAATPITPASYHYQQRHASTSSSAKISTSNNNTVDSNILTSRINQFDNTDSNIKPQYNFQSILHREPSNISQQQQYHNHQNTSSTRKMDRATKNRHQLAVRRQLKRAAKQANRGRKLNIGNIKNNSMLTQELKPLLNNANNKIVFGSNSNSNEPVLQDISNTSKSAMNMNTASPNHLSTNSTRGEEKTNVLENQQNPVSNRYHGHPIDPQVITNLKTALAKGRIEKPGTPKTCRRGGGRNPETAHLTIEERRQIRAQKNRESAEKSRIRRKQQTVELETDVGELRVENKELKERLLSLERLAKKVEESIEANDADVGDPNDVRNKGLRVIQESIAAIQACKQDCLRTFREQLHSPEIELKFTKATI